MKPDGPEVLFCAYSSYCHILYSNSISSLQCEIIRTFFSIMHIIVSNVLARKPKKFCQSIALCS